MKLNDSPCNACAGSYYFSSTLIDEQEHRSDKGRQAAGQLGGARQGNMARTFFLKHKPDGVDSGGHGRIHILLARQTANLDSGSGTHGNPSKAGVRSGKPQWAA